MDSSEIADCNGEKHIGQTVQVPQPENVTPDTSQVDAPIPTKVNTRNREAGGKPTEIADTTRIGRKASAATADDGDDIKKHKFRVSPTPPGWHQRWSENQSRWYCVRYKMINGERVAKRVWSNHVEDFIRAQNRSSSIAEIGGKNSSKGKAEVESETSRAKDKKESHRHEDAVSGGERKEGEKTNDEEAARKARGETGANATNESLNEPRDKLGRAETAAPPRAITESTKEPRDEKRRAMSTARPRIRAGSVDGQRGSRAEKSRENTRERPRTGFANKEDQYVRSKSVAERNDLS